MSVEFGWRKPAPAIFEHTLERLGVSAESCVYVGDNYAADYEGARNAGLRPLLIDPEARFEIAAEERLADILDLEARLAQDAHLSARKS